MMSKALMRKNTPTETIGGLAEKFGICDFGLVEPLIVGKGPSWYLVTEERELGQSGDLYFKRLFISIFGDRIISYADCDEVWGRSIASADFYLHYPTGSPEYNRLMTAAALLCPQKEQRVGFSLDEEEAEAVGKHHLMLVVNELNLPDASFDDAFANNDSYVSFLNAVKAYYLPHRGHVVMTLEDPAMAYISAVLDGAGEALGVTGGLRCEFI